MSGELVADLRVLTALVCQGRALSADGTGSEGDVCGAVFEPRRGSLIITGLPLLDRARAAGWRVGARADGQPDAICPDCARPAPNLVTLCRQLGKGGGG